MENFVTPFTLYLIATISAGLLAVALPFALWYYLRAKAIAPILTKKAALEQIVENLNQEIEVKKDELNNLTEAMVQARELIEQRRQAEQWMHDRQNEIANLQQQIERARAASEEAQQRLNVRNQQVEERTTQLAELNIQRQNAEARWQELDVQCARLKADRDALQKQIKALDGERGNLRQEVDTLRQKRDRLSGEVAQYEARKRELEEMRNQRGVLESTLSNLRGQIAEGENIIARAEVHRRNDENMWRDLERPVAQITARPEHAHTIDEQEEALEYFSNCLDQCRYWFDMRTIKAFHTSLLCGETSPLVVLSGISGTGKSLLPELYAKAFNMNFLPIAVQPRWDGPQDLFGFYNHMEGRFKATELSRLLWQFDIHNNREAGRKYPNGRNLPMSLVLLDEMNLARVEYYFSELLSKLEIRNHEMGERDAAEIELEYGAPAMIDQDRAQTMARRLFVGTNILFVGTMNEDESTQTLSSKVIDRSNVLRFGTPEHAQGNGNNQNVEPPDGERFAGLCKKYVSHETWKQWGSPRREGLDHLAEHITTLRQALGNVDRGFGYRTENAIRAYVSCYPGNSNDALADQIEMKVLPKLNGVEMDLVQERVANSIRNVLENIGDHQVLDAFNATLQADSTFFTWKGVGR